MKLNSVRRLSLLSLAATIALTISTVHAATIDERLAPCVACHGDKGQSFIPEVPSLGGQPAFFVSVQLLMFREKIRNLEPMTGMMKGVSDDELRRMAAAIAKLPAPPPAGEPPDPSRAERARALIQQQRCNFCHNQDFSGEQNAPRLAGQREDYLVKALRDYKSNSRRAYDALMADAVYPLSDADIVDLAYFLARFK